MAKSPLTLTELESFFLDWLSAEVHAGRTKNRTLRYYRTWLNRFVHATDGDRQVTDLVAYDLERCKRGWHSVQAVQRLFHWAVNVGLVEVNPFAAVDRPELGQRERVLQPAELYQLLRICKRPLRDILLAMRLTLARPQEIRALQWIYYRPEISAFVLTEFKAKTRRKDKARFRTIPVVPRLQRLLSRLRRRNTDIRDAIFLTAHRRPWTANALRLAVRRAARRAGLDADGQENKENVVAYTIRHTGATEAMAAGVSDRVLAEIMGHTSTRTTARYQHPQAHHLAEALRLATQRRRA